MPSQLHHVVMRSHSAATFIGFLRNHEAAKEYASDVTLFDAGVPGVDLFFCTVGGVPIEFIGSFSANSAAPTD